VQVFDILPLYGVLRPYSSHQISFTFYGHCDIIARAKALCEVEGGPTYEVLLKGEASLVNYSFDTKDINYGLQVLQTSGWGVGGFLGLPQTWLVVLRTLAIHPHSAPCPSPCFQSFSLAPLGASSTSASQAAYCPSVSLISTSFSHPSSQRLQGFLAAPSHTPHIPSACSVSKLPTSVPLQITPVPPQALPR
jgi:hypothetical protein